MTAPFQLYKGDRVGIVGANGTGKTTLLQLLAGSLEPDLGIVSRHGSLAVVAQLEPTIGSESGGEATRRRLTEALGLQAELLLVDEPTSHLDLQGIKEVEKLLRHYKGAIVLISHDRELLDNVCTAILELENGRLTLYAGNYSQYRVHKENERNRAELAYAQNVQLRERLTDVIADKKKRAVRAIRPPKRIGPSEARMGKDYFQSKAAKIERNVKAIERRLEKLGTVEKPRELPAVHFDIQAHVPIHSKVAIRINQVTRTVPLNVTPQRLYSAEARQLNRNQTLVPVHNGERDSNTRTLFRDLSLTIRPGDKVVLLGSNGSGKSTLLGMIADQSDGIRLAAKAKVGYFDQQINTLKEADTIMANVMSSSIYPEEMVRNVLARLLFRHNDVFKPVAMLSGGERVKTALAKLFLSDCNILLLDEPTNYLDIPAKEELEKVLKAYPGTIICATHDRRFAAMLADKILHLEESGHHWFDGAYEDYAQIHSQADAKEAVRQKQQPGKTGSFEAARSNQTIVEEWSEQLLRLELERNVVLARLSLLGRNQDPTELDDQYKLVTKKLELLNLQER